MNNAEVDNKLSEATSLRSQADTVDYWGGETSNYLKLPSWITKHLRRSVYDILYGTEKFWRSSLEFAEKYIANPATGKTPPDARVLDIGCGTGLLLEQLIKKGLFEPKNIYGYDFAINTALREAQKKPLIPRGNLIGGDLNENNATPFKEESFDVVFMEDVAEHTFVGISGCLEEVKRLLKPGGKAFIGVPLTDTWAAELLLGSDRTGGPGKKDRDPTHINKPTTPEVFYAIKDSKLDLLEWHFYFPAPAPIGKIPNIIPTNIAIMCEKPLSVGNPNP